MYVDRQQEIREIDGYDKQHRFPVKSKLVVTKGDFNHYSPETPLYEGILRQSP